MLEKRKYPRIKCQIYTELKEDNNSILGIGEIFDISEGGAGLESHTPFVSGQKAVVRFMLEGDIITLPIEIVRVEERVRRKFYGIKFINAPPETTQKIKNYVEKSKKE